MVTLIASVDATSSGMGMVTLTPIVSVDATSRRRGTSIEDEDVDATSSGKGMVTLIASVDSTLSGCQHRR
ncbi:hypothetical protein E2C01_038367 [Portunus trituberculatus]|uniref:Uncharacterized protein n=1 Tax=Portunus trituberculatus TaxID=210409 RepID=A0A5B7FID1_PORTR|nr:hypothetical protein [Portunus trituberculatus]